MCVLWELRCHNKNCNNVRNTLLKDCRFRNVKGHPVIEKQYPALPPNAARNCPDCNQRWEAEAQDEADITAEVERQIEEEDQRLLEERSAEWGGVA